jgi:hypothetical protein
VGGEESLVHFQSQFDDRAVFRATDDSERADPPWRSALAKIVHKIRQRLYIEDRGLVSHGSLPRHGSGIEIGNSEGHRAVARNSGLPEGQSREYAGRRIETTIDAWLKPPSGAA